MQLHTTRCGAIRRDILGSSSLQAKPWSPPIDIEECHNSPADPSRLQGTQGPDPIVRSGSLGSRTGPTSLAWGRRRKGLACSVDNRSRPRSLRRGPGSPGVENSASPPGVCTPDFIGQFLCPEIIPTGGLSGELKSTPRVERRVEQHVGRELELGVRAGMLEVDQRWRWINGETPKAVSRDERDNRRESIGDPRSSGATRALRRRQFP